MAPGVVSISEGEFKLFHFIDRELYTILVMKLWRDPVEAMQIMAFWLWLERMGCRRLVKKILSLHDVLINDLVDECITCLTCITSEQLTWENTDIDIPLLQSFTDQEISLKYFYDSRLLARQGVEKVTNEVCMRGFGDIIQQAASARNATQNKTVPPSSSFSFFSQPIFEFSPRSTHVTKGTTTTTQEDRTLFVTFSRGFPVYEWEVREFLAKYYGDCIKSLHMQEAESHKQALYARIVFHSLKTVKMILNGMEKARFVINGKHVWARKFVSKHSSPSVPTVEPRLPNASVPLEFLLPTDLSFLY